MIFIFSVEDLKDLYPDSTDAERQRFFRAFHNGDHDVITDEKNMPMENMLGKYLDFRKKYNLNRVTGSTTDKSDWKWASSIAMEALLDKQANTKDVRRKSVFRLNRSRRRRLDESRNSSSTESTTSTSDTSTSVSSTIFSQYMFAHKISRKESLQLSGRKDRRFLFQIIPSKTNFRKIPLDVHVLLLALYLDRKFDRGNQEKAILAIDLQDGSNSAVIPTVRSLMEQVHSYHPKRFQNVLVHPLPKYSIRKKVFSSEIKLSLDTTHIWRKTLLTKISGLGKSQCKDKRLESRKWSQAKPIRHVKLLTSGDGIEVSL